MESLLDKIRKDVKKGWAEGIAAVMQGANVVSLKMNELSEEGKRQYRMFNLHVQIKDQINELGGLAYTVLENGKSLDENKKMKAVYKKIKKLEWQLGKLEGSTPRKATSPGKPAKKTASSKTIKK